MLTNQKSTHGIVYIMIERKEMKKYIYIIHWVHSPLGIIEFEWVQSSWIGRGQ